MEACIGVPLKDCFLGFGLGPEEAEAGAHHFQAFFEGRGFAEGKLYPGIRELLTELRAGGHRLAVVSAKPTFAVRFVCESLQILPYFDGLFGCAPKDLSPQKRPILAEALAVTGWKAQDCVFVGDRDQDRDAAAAFGIPFIAAGWGFGTPAEHAGARAIAADVGALREALRG